MGRVVKRLYANAILKHYITESERRDGYTGVPVHGTLVLVEMLPSEGGQLLHSGLPDVSDILLGEV
jgi:hypothetical protein